ncbi:ANTR protein, partial [Turnix velox]|nr:ANTR protein [Turnix velox]
MKVKLCLGLILSVVATTCLCRPMAGTSGAPQRLPPLLLRRDWPQFLSQEQKHLISHFLPHIPAELRDSKGYSLGDKELEALHEHFYPDWLDFGRRSAEDAA